MMRIITGLARGKKLKTLEGVATRPTTERTKEAVFSTLFDKTVDANVLDLFAGSGQMGIEALSRGAKHCTFVEQARDALAVIKYNLDATRLAGKATLEFKEVLSFLASAKCKYDLIFLDPPYGKGLVDETVSLIEKYGLLSDGGIIVAESDDVDEVKEVFGDIKMYRKSKYGRAVVRYYAGGDGE